MELNQAQLAAVQASDRSILCLAGPGSGKTRTLIARLQRLLDDGVKPSGIACITFTNTAAEEIRDRLDGATLGWTGTLHGFCLRLLQRHGHLIGLTGHLTVLDEQQTNSMLAQTARELNYRGTMATLEREIKGGPKLHLGQSARTLNLAQITAQSFFRRLRAANLLTFDTVLSYAASLLVQHRDQITGWTHLLVDEVQDSADMDFVIYRELPVQHRFMVGDVDQSIFAFRGANVQNAVALAADPSWRVLLLEDNFRSDQSICRAAQNLIDHNPDRPAKRTMAVSTEPGMVVVQDFPDDQAELKWLAQEIRAKALVLSRDSVAVLLRTNRLVDQFAKGLESYGIPVARKARKALPEDWTKCKGLLALLSAPENDVLACWWVESQRGAAAASRAKLEAAAAGQSVNEMFLHIPDDVSGMNLANVLAKGGISRESIAIVTEKLAGTDGTLAELLLALAEDQEQSEEIGYGVTVTTMHGAKGREFDCVFLPAFEQAVIPGTVDGTELAEMRRLAFVAITRARHFLALSWAKTRRNPWTGQPEETGPSQFVEEAGL